MNGRAMLIGIILFVACLSLLFIAYPWATYYGNFHFDWRPTLISYLIVAALIGIGSGVTDILLRNSILSAPVRCVICAGIVFSFVVLVALLFGPMGVEIPGTRVRGIFFSEWRFINFIGYLGIPLSVIVLLLELAAGRMSAKQ